jgi:hypothetical protein
MRSRASEKQTDWYLVDGKTVAPKPFRREEPKSDATIPAPAAAAKIQKMLRGITDPETWFEVGLNTHTCWPS